MIKLWNIFTMGLFIATIASGAIIIALISEYFLKRHEDNKKKDEKLNDIRKNTLNLQESFEELSRHCKKYKGCAEIPLKNYENYLFNGHYVHYETKKMKFYKKYDSLESFLYTIRIDAYVNLKKDYMALVESINEYRHLFKDYDFLKTEKNALLILLEAITCHLENFISQNKEELEIFTEGVVSTNLCEQVVKPIFEKC